MYKRQLELTGWSLLLTVAFGLAAALLQRSTSWAGHAVARVYVEMVRNTPLLVQLYLVYFILAPILAFTSYLAHLRQRNKLLRPESWGSLVGGESEAAFHFTAPGMDRGAPAWHQRPAGQLRLRTPRSLTPTWNSPRSGLSLIHI